MAPYIGVTICRSDGVLEYSVNKSMITNGPKEQKPDAKGRVYKKLGPNDAKELEWRKKLGAKMMASFGEAEQKDKEYILNNLPEGYVLWDHSAPEGESGLQKTGTRTDAYLYGHPAGRTKRFRSPQEFLPHLRWLAMDDKNPCVCKVCTSTQKEVALSKITAAETPAMKPATTPSQPSTTTASEQLVDSDINVAYIYRLGELVWFNKGTAWGLAIVCKRQITGLIPHYLLQPLSHPLRHCPPLTKSQDALRPWLAWSVPNTTHRDIGNLRFDEVPWERVLGGEFGSGDAEVDGSILSGKAINDSYTLIDSLGPSMTNHGDVCYNGMFLGAEKVWVGEPVRLRVPNNDIVVMVVEQIVESSTTSTMTASPAEIIGDMFKFVQMPLPGAYKDRKNWPTPRLPPRMVADLQFRNENSANAKTNVWFEWQLLESRARRALSVIKGRWYETRTLIPILRPAAVEEELSRGITYDAGVWMNARYDTTNESLSKMKTRLEAIGRAVPKDLKISPGLDGSAANDKFTNKQSNFQLSSGVLSGQYGSTIAVSEREEGHFMDIDAGDHQDFYGNA